MICILAVDSPVAVAIAASKRRSTRRQIDGASGGLCKCSGVWIAHARQSSLRVHCARKLVQSPAEHSPQSGGAVDSQLLVALGVGTVGLVVLDVHQLGSEL